MLILNVMKRLVTRQCVTVILRFALITILFIILSIATFTHNDPMPSKLAHELSNTHDHIVNDVTEMNPIKVPDIIVPHSIDDISSAVKNHDHISIGGGRFSMGGQTASERAVQIDMREYNKILQFSADRKEITVQAGATWREIQDYIDPYNLSIKIMQTYSNFTVGGSLSVNVHGRYMGLGPIILSVKKISVVLANGKIVEASPLQNSDIFYSAIGGMGGIGIISDVTLELAENTNVERSRVVVSVTQYWDFFQKNIRSTNNIIFHNGDLYPPDFEFVSAVSWSITDKKPTTEDRLIPKQKDYWLERFAWIVMSEWHGGPWIRQHIIDPLIYMGYNPVHTRNYEASYDVAELEPENRTTSSYVLQEYFVPVEHFDEWIPKMKKVFTDHNVNVINVSIRHALQDPGSQLAWAKKESFAFVIYYKQRTDEESKKEVSNWTREMIEAVLTVNGTYYLPYQLHATDEQFHEAYPNAVNYFTTKKKLDPTDKFTNKLWDRYYNPEKISYYKEKQKELSATNNIRDYNRPLDNTYLSLPEWYIVYAADEYARVLETGLPSDFDYSKANQLYWEQYKKVSELTQDSNHNNRDYDTVLKVIGSSFSAENIIKVLYENTVGRLSEWGANNTQVPEDKYAATVAKDYATFIYDYPWYDFPYFSYFKGLWKVHSTDHFSFGQNIRRTERKMILSFEYGIKTIYSKIIAYATHEKFGVQDDIIYAVITKNSEKTFEIISARHYQPFTRKLLELMAQEQSNDGFSIIDIAGNRKISFVYVDKANEEVISYATEVTRNNEVTYINNSQKIYRDRITAVANVSDIFQIYKLLKIKGIKIEHFYDY